MQIFSADYVNYVNTDPFSLGLGKYLSVHDGRCGDASCHWVDLEQSTHAWWLDGVGHLTILALIHILSQHLGEGQVKKKREW